MNKKKEFEKTSMEHLRGEGCPKCGYEKMEDKLRAKQELIIKRFENKHGNRYDYKLVEYRNIDTKVKIICKKHGIFEQSPYIHIKGHGCKKCGYEIGFAKQRGTKEKFIKKAKEIHGDKYDYSLVDYKGIDKKIKIICPVHGIFEQIPFNHIKGHNCNKCGNLKISESQRSNTEDFIKKAKKIHGNKYDYSLVDYNKSNQKIKIICSIHGMFEQSPSDHLGNKGCNKCGNLKISESQRSNTEDFIKKAKKIHGSKYDYSLVDYKGAFSKVKIICKKHGVFEQVASKHVSGDGCDKCGIEKTSESQRSNTEDFIKKAKKIHGNKYDYSLVDYKGAFSKVKIICKKHGVFEQQATSHLNANGCPVCNESKGEEKIRQYLINNKIDYKEQYRFNDCRNKKPLPFDFYLPKYNTVIEFQGEQHYRKDSYFYKNETSNNNMEYRKINDNIKRKYCLEKNINEIEIKYTDIKNIKEILDVQIEIFPDR